MKTIKWHFDAVIKYQQQNSFFIEGNQYK